MQMPMQQQTQQMSVFIQGMQQLFFKPVRYEIPALQRRYVWNQEEQWEPLWDDVVNKAESYLEGEASAHFLGAIVIQAQQSQFNRRESWAVVDGQQRLTTMQLLLDAAQEVFARREYKDNAQRLSDLVLNRETYGGGGDVFKIVPTLNDRQAFQQAMDNELPNDVFEDSRIVQAHEFFKDQIGHWLDDRSDQSDQPDQGDQKVDALEFTLTHLLQIVVIALSSSEAAHVIFETLNARGTPLLESDMVKNMVIQEFGITDEADETKVWEFSNNWWQTEITQGRLVRPRVDVLLNYWLVIRKKNDVAANQVFYTFRNEFNESGESIADITADIARMGKAYRKLEEARIEGLETFLYRRRVMQAGTLNPPLLWLLSREVPHEQMRKAILALESFLVRRMVCGMITREYSGLFIEMVDALDKAGVEHAGEAVVEFLKRQGAYARQWPDNGQFEWAFRHRKVYGPMTQGRIRIVLEGIEEELRRDWAEDSSVPKWLAIEHIMPQGWQQNWKLPDDVEDEAPATDARNYIIHTLGNLTLTSKKLNSRLSNAPWDRKQEVLGEHSVLRLNRTLLTDAPDVWDEAAIDERARLLCATAIRVWPHADGIA